MNLFMVLLGCTPEGRYTEQHDIFFGIAEELKDLIDDFNEFWPEAKGKLHIDVWRKVEYVDGYKVSIQPKTGGTKEKQLFFLNLGGYKPGDFEEYHYKTLCLGTTQAEAIKKAKKTSFYKHCGFEGANSHIDDKYGIDVDDVYNVEDILAPKFKTQFELTFTVDENCKEDNFNIGYLKLSTLK
ncbi:hypothetical protein NBRC110019_29140 [Neptunitalea chrysea]|uniref:DUF1543 domain-containing protein n=1 Tax=Neptunitalea chrysea TaxID=1647581 RepID=A0A9W6EWX0_9FLAO|nr:DUF1543 domain-containing protein [Neptunitalea chrysea]GLB53873.1 hypothetical protein NBRC110019_29140 [Neptunitalea chrysea]